MARTISTKLAVEGEAQYKQAIASCNSELSTLKSSLALVESEFRGNANSMEALTAKGAALDSMYKKQQEKVSTLEAALRNAQRAQEEYASRVSTAQSNIERCERALETLRRSTGDTTAEQEELTKELDKWNAELEEAQAGQAAAERGVQNWQKQLNNAKVELNGLSDEIDKNNGYLDEARNSADGCADSIDEFGNEVDQSKKGIEALAAALAAAGIAKTVKEIADSLMECAQASTGFETALAKLSTLIDTKIYSMADIKAELLELSNETGVAVGALAEAAYQARSAGVDTADVVNFVTTATKTSVAGFTDSATAVDILTTALNAYHMEGTQAERVASMLVKTQDEGKVSVGELAQNMGRVIPTAATLNVSLENLTTAYAILTKNGTNAAISTTNISAMFDELASDGSTVADVLEKQTGKSFSELMASGSNLGDIIAILSESVDGNSDAFKNLWNSTTAGKAAVSILNAGAEEFNSTLLKMETSSGSVEKNFQTMAATTEFAQQRMTNAAENLKIAIGDQLTPALANLYNTGADAFTWATDFANENPWIVGAIVGVTTALGALSVGVAALAAAPQIIAALKVALDLLAANPIVAVTAAVVGLTVAIGTWIAASKEADEGTKAFIEAMQESKAAYEELSETMAAEQEATAATAASLQELLAVEEKSALQKDLIAQKVAELNEAIPGLGLAYDKERDSLEGLTEAELASAIERAAAREEYETQVARLNELDTERAAIEARLTEARLALNEAEETGVGNTRELQNNINELTAALEENAEEYAELEAASAEYAEQQAATAQKTQEATRTVEGLISEMENLQAAYEESYNSAMESIDGQLGLFNELDGSAKASIEDLIGTLQGQVAYMETYAANIQRAMELGVDEGLIRKLSDGSEASAQILAAIVEGGEEDIAALNEQLAKVEEGKDNFSQTVADMENDFNEKMTAIEKRVKEMVDELDASTEAQTAGMATIGGYINGAESMRSSLVAKYKSLATAANNSFTSTLDINSPSRVFREHGKNTVRGAIEGVEEEELDLERAYSALAESAIRAYQKSRPSGSEAGLLAAQREQTAAIVAAVRDRGGGAPGGIAIYVDKLEVRDDSDPERIARELYYLTERESRSRGGGSL